MDKAMELLECIARQERDTEISAMEQIEMRIEDLTDVVRNQLVTPNDFMELLQALQVRQNIQTDRSYAKGIKQGIRIMMDIHEEK